MESEDANPSRRYPHPTIHGSGAHQIRPDFTACNYSTLEGVKRRSRADTRAIRCNSAHVQTLEIGLSFGAIARFQARAPSNTRERTCTYRLMPEQLQGVLSSSIKRHCSANRVCRGRLAHRWTRLGEILRVHHRSKRNLAMRDLTTISSKRIG